MRVGLLLEVEDELGHLVPEALVGVVEDGEDALDLGEVGHDDVHSLLPHEAV